MRQRVAALLLVPVLISALVVTGCWDRVEVNDIAIVTTTAFDLEEDGRFRVSVQVPLPGQMGGSSGGGGGTSGTKPFYVDSEVGDSIREAVQSLQMRMSRRLFFSHRRVMVIGEELAKRGIRELFDVSARVPENRLTADVLVAKGKGIDLLKARPQFEMYSGEAMRELLESYSMFNPNLKDIAHSLSQVGADPLLPLIEPAASTGGEKKQEVHLSGYAQFRDEKMIGTISSDQAEGLVWLRKEFRPFEKTIDVGKGKLVLSIYEGDTTVKSEIKPDHVHFNVEIHAAATVLEAVGAEDLGRSDFIERAQRELSKELADSVMRTTELIKERNSDIATLGILLSRTKPRIWNERLKWNWHEGELQKATFSVAADCQITRIGQITENLARRETPTE